MWRFVVACGHARRTHATHMRPWTSVDPTIFPPPTSFSNEYSQGGDGRAGEDIEMFLVDLDEGGRDIDEEGGIEATASVDDERRSG